MEDALKLQGYLMKEKSKFSRLHGLTGDINKRYFRIRNIEGSGELALCYYKNSADREVRGWIYLTDVTEIAERQDTIILTSVARTLHLYAQTRAQHSEWVTGLAKLCPDAFTMLERDVHKAVGGIPPTTSVPTSSTKTKPIATPLAKDHNKKSSNDAPAAGHVVLSDKPEMSHKVDEEENSPATNEYDTRAELFPTPRKHDRRSKRNSSNHQLDKRNCSHRHPGERPESCHTPRSDAYNIAGRNDQQSDHHLGLGGDERGTKGQYRRRVSLHDGKRPQRASNGRVKRGEASEKGKTRHRTERQTDLRPKRSGNQGARKADKFDEQNSSPETAASPSSTCRSTDETDDLRDKRSATKHQPQDRQRGDGEASDTTNKKDGVSTAENWDVEQSLQRAAQPTDDSDTTSVKDAGVGTDGDEGAIVGSTVRSEANGDHSTNRTRFFPSDNENVETIELGEGARYDDIHIRQDVQQNRATGQAQQQAERPAPADVLKGSNQDEEKESDEEAQIDLVLPQLEIGAWGDPHQEQLAKSRLHRHVSGSDTEGVGVNGGIPPPKEFLKKASPKSMANEPREDEVVGSNGGQNRNLENSSLANVPKSASRARRRSAADLEWNDGGETPDRPRCVESKGLQLTDCTPVDLGDSGEDGEDCLGLDVEKQRRRATAAIQALEAAAKEADEGARVENEALNGCKQSINDSTRRLIAKACPSPAGPPPPELVRKSRRGHGVPPVGVAPPKAVPPGRVKVANRCTAAYDNFVRDDWDDERKTSCRGTPVAGPRGTGTLPAAAVGASGTLSETTVGRNHSNHWIHFDD